ncbi:FkbM family methyltransferase [Campylobacter sp. LR196d]|uniref:FkbM family methyltransferase n=1 Tax=Campylobacter sp. LR196d TaxID=2593543 RepID=UPI00123C66D9|nr:FkbM family methyltransferase [Campylobacter sp. LR196d]KAA6227978.1 FkbM family methyltransferase [Campylobacter sp. LR196d]
MSIDFVEFCFKKSIDFSKNLVLDGGGSLAFSLSEGFFDEKYLNTHLPKLIKNLDKKSCEVVFSIINRLKFTYKNNKHIFPFLTSKEKACLKDIRENFQNKIFKINENLYFYDGFYLPVSAFEISVFYHKHSMHVLRHLDKLKAKDIMDIGAYIGDSALILSKFTNKKIYSFELDKKNFSLLKESLRLNKLEDKIKPFNLGLGKQRDSFYVKSGGIGSCIDKNLKTQELAQITSLDEFVKEVNVNIGFIKVDIEGAEMDFLQGAKHSICKYKPAMLISIYHGVRDFFEIKPLIESWNLGYSFKIYKPIDTNISAETALYCEILD